MAKKLSKSIRKYIRSEKARIRREVLDLEKQEKLIMELYGKFLNPAAKIRPVSPRAKPKIPSGHS